MQGYEIMKSQMPFVSDDVKKAAQALFHLMETRRLMIFKQTWMNEEEFYISIVNLKKTLPQNDDTKPIVPILDEMERIAHEGAHVLGKMGFDSERMAGQVKALRQFLGMGAAEAALTSRNPFS